MNDEQLTLYYYKDGLADEDERRIRAALRTDADLARRYEALCRELAGLDDPAPMPASATAAARWHAAIDSAADPPACADCIPRPTRPISLDLVECGRRRGIDRGHRPRLTD